MDSIKVCQEIDELIVNLDQENINRLRDNIKSESNVIVKNLPYIIPALSECIKSTNRKIVKQSIQVLEELCNLCRNKDIIPFIPTLIECFKDPNLTSDCINNLAATTFVSEIDTITLAVLTPVLEYGMKQRTITAIKRKCCLIIDNMCKLIEHPNEAYMFIKALEYDLEKISENISDPECRSIAKKAYENIMKVKEKQNPLNDIEIIKQNCVDMKEEEIKQIFYAIRLGIEVKNVPDTLKDFFYTKATIENEDNAEELCNCNFSLAYGAKILLSNTNLVLKKGRRYGLCGANGSGKSTLMKAIANDQVEGFPDSSVLKTVYIAHDIDGDDTNITTIEYTQQKNPDYKEDELKERLKEFLFTDEKLNACITDLSGGWKMKLALANAILSKPDILLLDEPTNHLDVKNVKWLTNYINNLTDVTSVIVSHDSTFLDNVCDYIIHYESLKLVTYQGNLSALVEIRPEAKSYYSLDESIYTFEFPAPGMLEGVKHKDKALIKLQKVNFGYNSEKNVLNNVNVQCSLASRIGVQGPNGAGKSTMIKLLTGDLKVEDGKFWKHPNVRVGYVAQHAFHHIEEHLDKTANEYIQWRFSSGMDKESLQTENNKYTEEELKELEVPRERNECKFIFDSIVGKKKQKNITYYEVKWKNVEDNEWIPEEEIDTMKFVKARKLFDEKYAAQSNLAQKPPTAANIEKHLSLIGLEPEFTTHSLMKGLSGGQKVKVVLGAATWNCPHLIIMDEPTNYLDRDSLSALSSALKSFEGGIIIISHNFEFINKSCTEFWKVDNGICIVEGNNYTREKLDNNENKEIEVVDALGNVSVVRQKSTKTLSRKELKAKQKLRQARIDRGEAVSDEED